jgi:hypothetical protein
VIEVLKTETIQFVNYIADLVHQTIFQYYGTVNKNLGDTFIVVWKVHELDKYFDGEFDLVIINESHICDLAIFSCLKSIASINKYNHIIDYNKNEEI